MSDPKKTGLSVSASKSYVDICIDLSKDRDGSGSFRLHLSREDALWLLQSIRTALG